MTTIKISSALNEREYGLNCMKDFENAKAHIIIESAFTSPVRLDALENSLRKAIARNVTVCVFLQKPRKQNQPSLQSPDFSRMSAESFDYCVNQLTAWGAHVTVRKKVHRKFVVVDQSIHYEGGLNMLSYCDTEEHMRRFEGSAETAAIIEKYGLLDCETCLENANQYACVDKTSVGQILSARRKEHGMRKSQLAGATGVSRQHISIIEKSRNCTIETLQSLSAALNLVPLIVPNRFAPAICQYLAKLEAETEQSQTTPLTVARDAPLDAIVERNNWANFGIPTRKAR